MQAVRYFVGAETSARFPRPPPCIKGFCLTIQWALFGQLAIGHFLVLISSNEVEFLSQSIQIAWRWVEKALSHLKLENAQSIDG